MTVVPTRTHRQAAAGVALALLAGCVPLLLLAPPGDPLDPLTFVLAAGAVVSVLGASKWEGSLQISASFVCACSPSRSSARWAPSRSRSRPSRDVGDPALPASSRCR